MNSIIKELEMRGMHRSEIIDYFISKGGIHMGEGCFKWKNWEVSVSEEIPVFIGSLQFPSSIVTFSGEEKVLNDEINAFRKRFLNAGG